MRFIGLMISLMLMSYGVQAGTHEMATMHFPPFAISSEDGKPKGSSVEIMELVGQEIGEDFVAGFYPWKRSKALVKQGKISAILGCALVPERAEDYILSEKIAMVNYGILYDKSKPVSHVKGYEDLKDYRIGVVSGLNLETMLQTMHVDYKGFQSDVNAIRLMADNRLDAVFGYMEPLEHNRKNMQIDIETAFNKFGSFAFGICFSKTYEGSAELALHVDQALRKFHKNGRINEILDKYGMGEFGY